jgi:hypothetical protein
MYSTAEKPATHQRGGRGRGGARSGRAEQEQSSPGARDEVEAEQGASSPRRQAVGEPSPSAAAARSLAS